jgi:hypothetical protein
MIESCPNDRLSHFAEENPALAQHERSPGSPGRHVSVHVFFQRGEMMAQLNAFTP